MATWKKAKTTALTFAVRREERDDFVTRLEASDLWAHGLNCAAHIPARNAGHGCGKDALDVAHDEAEVDEVEPSTPENVSK